MLIKKRWAHIIKYYRSFKKQKSKLQLANLNVKEEGTRSLEERRKEKQSPTWTLTRRKPAATSKEMKK